MRVASRFASILVLLFATLALLGTTWNVLEDGSGDAPTINAAMDLAEAGDTVLVWPGQYPAPLPGHRMATDVHLVSQGGPDVTAITADGSALLGSGTSITTLLDGFKFQGVGPLYGYVGVVQLWGDHEIRNCVFEDLAVSNKGAALSVGGSAHIHDSVFREVSGHQPFTETTTGVRIDGNHDVIIENCRFELNSGAPYGGILALYGNVEVRNCEFVGLYDGAYAVGARGESNSLIVEDCLFLGAAASPQSGVQAQLGNSAAIRGNTFVGFQGPGTRALHTSADVATIERNVFFGNTVAVRVAGGTPTFACNVLWNNATDWVGIEDQTGMNGNVVADPIFCDPANHVYQVAENSPCLPQNSNGCGLIGAFGQGCGAISVETRSWSAIKSLYR